MLDAARIPIRCLAIAFPAALACAAMVLAAPSSAATITVTTTADQLDAPAGLSGTCSLREAVFAVNQGSDYFTDCVATGSPYGTVDEVALGPLTYALTRGGDDGTTTNGDLDIFRSVIITGAGADLTTIDAGALSPVDRAIEVQDQPTAVDVSLRSLTIANGVAPASSQTGGGIRHGDQGSLTLSAVEVVGNSAASQGGGVYSVGPLGVYDSLFEGNHAGQVGGAIVPSGGTTTIGSSTLTGNSTDDSGGVIYVFVNQGPVNIIGTTIAGNTTANGDSGALQGENGPGAPVISVVQSILANTPRNCDSFRTYSGSRNLESANTCGFATLAPDNNLINTDPLLAPLALSPQSGTRTRTMALLPGSPAIDAIPIADCATSSDQRDEPRPLGAGCDIGAFEGQLDPIVSPPGNPPASAPATRPAAKKCKKKKKRGKRGAAETAKKKCKRRKKK